MKAYPAEADERALIAEAQRDASRFGALYERYFDRVYAFIVSRVHDRDAAEDLTSQTFHSALENLPKFEWRGVPFSAWLLRIAANAMADRWAKVGRERGDPAPEEFESIDTDAIENRARLFGLVRQIAAGAEARGAAAVCGAAQRARNRYGDAEDRRRGEAVAIPRGAEFAGEDGESRWLSKQRANDSTRRVTALLERRDSFVPQAGAELAPLISLAIDLRELPRESFRTKLKNELERRTTMSSNATPARETSGEAQGGAAKVDWKRKGFRTVTPYLVVDGAAKLMDFVKAVFGGEEIFRMARPDGKIMHAEARIGDAIIEMSDANEQFPARPMPIHVYVRDVDAAYARALEAGATSLLRAGGSGVRRLRLRRARSAGE